MIIGVSDPDQYTFSKQLIDHWKSMGHEVRTSLYHEEGFVAECDAIFYDFLSGDVVELTKFGVKPKRVVARAIDIELYCGYWNNINYDLIDSLIFLNSDIMEFIYSKGLSCPREKVHIIKPGVDFNKFTLKTAPQTKKAVFVGRLWIGKNVVGAIDLVHELNKIDPGWELHIRGDRPDPHWWEKYMEHRKSVENFPIHVDSRVDDMNQYLEDKDLMIVSSYKEAFSYVGCEALAKGIPAVFNNYFGATSVWPKELIYNTPGEGAILAAELVKKDRQSLRNMAYDEKVMFEKIDKLMGVI